MRELCGGFVPNMRAWSVTWTNEGGDAGQQWKRGLWGVEALQSSRRRPVFPTVLSALEWENCGRGSAGQKGDSGTRGVGAKQRKRKPPSW
jgi:hypothetical protein